VVATLHVWVFLMIASALSASGGVASLSDPYMQKGEQGLTASSYLVLYLIIGPLMVGYANVLKHNYYGEQVEMAKEVVNGTLSHYLRYVLGFFLMSVKLMLWTLLLIIPGIIMSFAYAMTPYILEDRPELSAWEASTESRRMMKGHKLDYFRFCLSFIGWFLLCLITCGIGFIWFYPYFYSAKAAFYNEIKASTAESVN